MNIEWAFDRVPSKEIAGNEKERWTANIGDGHNESLCRCQG